MGARRPSFISISQILGAFVKPLNFFKKFNIYHLKKWRKFHIIEIELIREGGIVENSKLSRLLSKGTNTHWLT
jgi:hypothetical protein